MSEVRLVIRDPSRDIQTLCDPDFARCAVAALSAEPETIVELKGAVERYLNPGESSNFSDYSQASEQPCDKPTVIIDLPARLVASDFLFEAPAREEELPEADDDEEREEEALPRLRLSDDWEISDSIADWQAQDISFGRRHLGLWLGHHFVDDLLNLIGGIKRFQLIGDVCFVRF